MTTIDESLDSNPSHTHCCNYQIIKIKIKIFHSNLYGLFLLKKMHAFLQLLKGHCGPQTSSSSLRVWPLLIYMWVLSQSYQLSSKLHLVSPNSTFFPFIPYVSQCFPRMIFLLLLLSLFFPQNPPKCWPSSLFYSLSLVGLSSLPFPHFARIPTSIRIPRNPHNLRGISWNLF